MSPRRGAWRPAASCSAVNDDHVCGLSRSHPSLVSTSSALRTVRSFPTPDFSMMAGIPSHVRPVPSELQSKTVKTLRAGILFGPFLDQIRRCKANFHEYGLGSFVSAETTGGGRNARVASTSRDRLAPDCDRFIFTRGASFRERLPVRTRTTRLSFVHLKSAQVAKPCSARNQSEPNARPGDTFSAARSRGIACSHARMFVVPNFQRKSACFNGIHQRLSVSYARRIRGVCLG